MSRPSNDPHATSGETAGQVIGHPSILDRFFDHATADPDRPALWVDGGMMTYGALAEAVKSAAVTLSAFPDRRPVALVADRSTNHIAILAAIADGRAFVPLHPSHPVRRRTAVWNAVGATLLMAGPDGLASAHEVIEQQARTGSILVLGTGPRTRDAMAQHTDPYLYPAEDTRSFSVNRDKAAAERVAYILFTSGSTGEPKGVAVSHHNVLIYTDYIIGTYGVGPTDRCSQVFEQTFDLCMHDIFVTFSAGACLYSLPASAQLMPGNLRDHDLTVWFSTPSTAAFMQRAGALKADAFPSLKVSLFCGEALPATLASAWGPAAPNSRVENLYGPTEATIAITRFEILPEFDAAGDPVVPIGLPFSGQTTALLDRDGHYQEVRHGKEGELILSGSQVSMGYWEDPALTAHAFPTSVPGDPQGRRWYRTGDWVRYDSDVGFRFLSRTDDQIKIRGHRVSLAEIDAVLRDVAGTPVVATIAWPPDTPTADGVIGFVCNPKADGAGIREQSADRLPSYMIPRKIDVIDDMPLTTSGKIDRKALAKRLLPDGEHGCGRSS